MDKKDLSIIIVNFNTKDLLRNCLNSISKNTKGIDYEIIVVDNASNDGSVEMLKKEFPEVKLICNRENLGFARANNQGIKIAEGRNILFLNPDTWVLNNAISKMVNFIERHKDIGVVGSKLYKNEKREYHPSIRKFTKPIYIFLSFLPLAKLFLSIYNKYFLNKNRIKIVDWLSGAALLVKRELLDKIGFFDENFFMYSEEEDLCYRAYKSGYKICYFPEAEIIHFKGKSTESRRIESCRYFWESKLYFFQKYSHPYEIQLFKIYFTWLLKLKMFFKIIPKDNYNKTIIETIKKIPRNYQYVKKK